MAYFTIAFAAVWLALLAPVLARNGLGFGKAPPQPGDVPQVWVEVDFTRPYVRFSGADAGAGGKATNILLRWSATDKNLVVRPGFDLRAQPNPAAPGAGTVRVFAREVGGKTQLCAMFPGGAVHVLAADA